MNNYQDALGLIKNSKRALQFLHISPDEDSIASNLAFKQVAESLSDCKIDIVSEDTVKEELFYLSSLKDIKKVDMGGVDFSQYDLFILLDISDLTRLSKNPKVKLPNGAKILNIDHHITNSKFGQVNIVEPEVGSTAQLLYKVFSDWKTGLDPELATLLLLGITGDTGTFQYSGSVSAETFRVASELMAKGADYRGITFNMHQNIPLGTFKLWSFIFENLQQGESAGTKYVWSAVKFEDQQRLRMSFYESGTSRFFASIQDTDFGLMLTEEDKGYIKGSLRSRTGVDVSKIAQELGGGGHKLAAGFRYALRDLSFGQGVQKILEIMNKVLSE